MKCLDIPPAKMTGPARVFDPSGTYYACVSNSTLYLFIDEANRVAKCVNDRVCIDSKRFTLAETRECITPEACAALETPHYAYAGIGECSTAEPEENGGFDAGELLQKRYACKK